MLILKVTNFSTLQNMYSNPYKTCSHKKHYLPKPPKGKKSCGKSLQAPEGSSISLQFGIGQAWPCHRCAGVTQPVTPCCPASYHSCGFVFQYVISVCIFGISVVTSSTTLSRSNELSSGAEQLFKFHELPSSILYSRPMF